MQVDYFGITSTKAASINQPFHCLPVHDQCSEISMAFSSKLNPCSLMFKELFDNFCRFMAFSFLLCVLNSIILWFYSCFYHFILNRKEKTNQIKKNGCLVLQCNLCLCAMEYIAAFNRNITFNRNIAFNRIIAFNRNNQDCHVLSSPSMTCTFTFPLNFLLILVLNI